MSRHRDTSGHTPASQVPPRRSTMILYLLCPLLIAGIKSQTANVTVEERSRAEGNQTFGVSTGENVTSSLNQVEESLIKEELENNNLTFVTDEDGRFQDQDQGRPSAHRHCNHIALVDYSPILCGAAFHDEMLMISSENWCDLDHISGPYSNLTRCLEKLSGLLDCFYPNQDTQDFFLSIHSEYFQDCSNEEVFVDAPHWVVMVLTLVPVSIIPLLVYLVVWKSKVQE